MRDGGWPSHPGNWHATLFSGGGAGGGGGGYVVDPAARAAVGRVHRGAAPLA